MEKKERPPVEVLQPHSADSSPEELFQDEGKPEPDFRWDNGLWVEFALQVA